MNALKLQELAPTMIELPTEILRAILSYLSDLSSLFRLLLVCSRFHSIAEPLLYSHLDIHLLPLTRREGSPGSGYRNFNELIRRLKKDPLLAQHTTRLSISANAISCDKTYKSVSHKELVKVLPNLEELTLRPPPCNLEIRALTASCPKRVILDFKGYSQLRGSMPGDFTMTETLLRSCFASNVRKLKISHCCFDRAATEHSHVGLSKITDLPFLKCSVSHGRMVHESLPPLALLLLRTKALHRLWLELKGVPIGTHVDCRLARLIPHTNPLEDLCFVLDSDFNILPNQRTIDKEPLGSFSAFTSLKRLTIPARVLIREQRVLELPPRIEELQLQVRLTDKKGTAIYFGILAALVNHEDLTLHCPDLRHLVWWHTLAEASDIKGLETASTAFSDKCLVKLQNARHGLEKRGVKFEWVAAEWFEQTPLGRFP